MNTLHARLQNYVNATPTGWRRTVWFAINALGALALAASLVGLAMLPGGWTLAVLCGAIFWALNTSLRPNGNSGVLLSLIPWMGYASTFIWVADNSVRDSVVGLLAPALILVPCLYGHARLQEAGEKTYQAVLPPLRSLLDGKALTLLTRALWVAALIALALWLLPTDTTVTAIIVTYTLLYLAVSLPCMVVGKNSKLSGVVRAVRVGVLLVGWMLVLYPVQNVLVSNLALGAIALALTVIGSRCLNRGL